MQKIKLHPKSFVRQSGQGGLVCGCGLDKVQVLQSQFSNENVTEVNKFVFQVTYKEIDEMIETVDKNGDGKISFSEFR